MPFQRTAKVPGATLVLEEVAGNTAQDMFLAQNHRDHEVVVRPEISQIADPSGVNLSQLGQKIWVDPKEFRLAARSQRLIRIFAPIDDNLLPDVLYRCELTMPTLSDVTSPVIVQRRKTKTIPTPGT
jgi:hypothetical protein